MAQLKFYTTAHCSLCEQTLDLLLATPELAGYRVETIDIADHQELLERYGDKIPVLNLNGEELSAPIDRNCLLQWIARFG
ncbi:MAG: glutaredoxin family protein [bacterium]